LTTDRVFTRDQALTDAGIRTCAYVADLTDRDPVKALVQRAFGDLGRVDILVNYACRSRSLTLEMAENGITVNNEPQAGFRRMRPPKKRGRRQ
jgi:NADP-dependent 3-hydroxy acid dehydrogenase YdfG